MARRLITAVDKIARARKLVKEARDLPVPQDSGTFNIYFVTEVKDRLKEAKDLIKFLPRSRTATAAIKKDVEDILADIKRADQEILRPK